MTENDIRANAVREAQAYIERISRKGLVPLNRVLADLAVVAQRMENGMTARGSTRPESGGLDALARGWREKGLLPEPTEPESGNR